MAIDRYQPSDRLPRDENRRRPSSPPLNIDRYVPGEDPPPTKLPTRTNPLPNPLSLDYQVGFNWFAEWWRTERTIKEEKERTKTGRRSTMTKENRDEERSKIQAAYDSYKIELQMKMAKAFVNLHKAEEWFKERYFEELRGPMRQHAAEYRRPVYTHWVQDIANGYFDDFNMEGIYKSESDGAGGIIPKEEGEATAVGETLGVQDLVPARGGALRDEALDQPALLIKTLSPTVSRDKIEAFCREHLGEGDGGFKWLSLSDPNPLKKYHRIGWIMLHPGSDAVTDTNERSDGRDEDMEAEEHDNSPPSTAQKALDAVNDKTIEDEERGNFNIHAGIHNPPSQPRKKALWDLFSAPERVEKDLELVRRVVRKLDSEHRSDEMAHDGVFKVQERVEDLRGKGWLQAPIVTSSSTKKEQTDSYSLDAPDEEEGEAESDEGAIEEENDDEDMLAKKKELDLLVEYLRRVYNFCFYCVFEADSVHELTRKCPGGHLRRPRAGLSVSAKKVAKASALGEPFPLQRPNQNQESETGEDPMSPDTERKVKRFPKSDLQLQRAYNWVRTFEDKLLQILEPENVDLKKIGGQPHDEAMDEELKQYVNQEDESKFRCKVPDCAKLFKAEHFWRKHVEKRHPEFFSQVQKDVCHSSPLSIRTHADHSAGLPCQHICPGSRSYCTFSL